MGATATAVSGSPSRSIAGAGAGGKAAFCAVATGTSRAAGEAGVLRRAEKGGVSLVGACAVSCESLAGLGAGPIRSGIASNARATNAHAPATSATQLAQRHSSMRFSSISRMGLAVEWQARGHANKAALVAADCAEPDRGQQG